MAGVLRRDVATALAVVALWLVPMGLTAITGYPPRALQPNLRDLYSVTCLFRHRTRARVSFYLQVRYADRRGFFDLDEAEYFPMQPFGHRSRFDRYMARFAFPEKAHGARQELADWITQRHAELHPDEAPVVAVRYLWTEQVIAEAPTPQGHYEKPRRIDRARHMRVLSVYVTQDSEQEVSP